MDEKKSSGDLTLEEIIVEIRHELEEDQLFLQEHYRLWEAGDRESAVVDERFRHVLLLTSIMDELLSSFLTEEKEKLEAIPVPKDSVLVPAGSGTPEEESLPGEAGETEISQDEEENQVKTREPLSADESNPELKDLRYTIHTLGSPDGAESVEADWAYDWTDQKSHKKHDKKESKKGKENKKGKKNKKSKKEKKNLPETVQNPEEARRKESKSKKKNRK
jgi:hypothetical protein